MVKKPGYRKLWKMYKELQATVALWTSSNTQLSLERDKWKRTAETRLDTQMLDARIRLAAALGQMMHTTSEAVKFVIGKEVL